MAKFNFYAIWAMSDLKCGRFAVIVSPYVSVFGAGITIVEVPVLNHLVEKLTFKISWEK